MDPSYPAIDEEKFNTDAEWQPFYGDVEDAIPVKSAPNPFVMGYEPDMDISTECDVEEATYFQSVIGIMRWMIEIGRIDVATEVSMLSSHLAYPREGHMEAALHVMA